MYAQDELNIRTDTPSPLLSKGSVQKGRAYFWELMVLSMTLCTACELDITGGDLHCMYIYMPNSWVKASPRKEAPQWTYLVAILG